MGTNADMCQRYERQNDWGDAISGLEEAGHETQEKRHRTYISDEDELRLMQLCVQNQGRFLTVEVA